MEVMLELKEYNLLMSAITLAIMNVNGTLFWMNSVKETVMNAVCRCENCGCKMQPNQRVCDRCGWDNWEHKEA